LFDGSWGWWQGSKANMTITNYVTQALLPLRNEPLVESSVRNALLYLHNHLSTFDKYERISILYTMSEANHLMNYEQYLSVLPFDSLSIHAQWQIVKIKQRQALEYRSELRKLVGKGISTMLGGLHWGEDSYWWDRNMMATTVLAYKTLQNVSQYTNDLKRITQFFLEHRKNGYWTNTVESASIISAILPSILSDNATFTAPASLSVNNSTTTNKFPFTTTIASPGSEVTINKTGGGLLYCTAYQEIFNKDPQPVTDKFRINTWFERSGNNMASLKAGEKVLMKIEIEVLADADYVQIEIPIPAGCTYGEKKQSGWDMHKEFLKEKAVFFIEKLPKGTYKYELDLEPRYTGGYTLNPAKAELMYFPVFYGRNQSKKISIKK
jgi:alpha-2-macroglobulin